jgi:hypothetical protein
MDKKLIMNKVLCIGVFSLVLLFGFTVITTQECDRKALSVSCKQKIEPYKYDSQNFSKINFSKKPQELEVEIPVFIGEKYRLVFNTSFLPKPIKIKVFTKSKESKKRVPIFSAENSNPEENQFITDISLVKKLFVSYEIPADSSEINTGCMMFMVGYK